MEQIDNKVIYNIISSKDLLKYLNIKDKLELSSTCKYIFEKCSCIRYENFHFSIMEIQKLINNTNMRSPTSEDILNLNLDYFNNAIDKYKKYLVSFYYSGQYFNLVDYFTLNFSNLSSFCMDTVTIPKQYLKKIIENLPYLQSLSLKNIMLAYPENDQQNNQFKFSKYLQKLIWENCFQFLCDSNDPIYLSRRSMSVKFRDYFTMDINIDFAKTLKYISWKNITPNVTRMLDKLLISNPDLTSFTVSFYSANPIPFSHISNSANLTHLTILEAHFSRRIVINQSMKFYNIKSLNIKVSAYENIESLNSMILNCPNLEKLNYFTFPGCEDYFINYISNLTQIKSISLDASHYVPTFQLLTLPRSNLEELRICSRYPINFNFKIFCNMKLLKLIENYQSTEYMSNWRRSINYKELKGWRMIRNYNFNSIRYWKI